jgi:DNA-directed RNA polymerase subunit RPC12/RpoP
MTTMSIHHRAMKHLQKAKALIASGVADDLRYAALEMRYCIEHLFYGFVPSYKQELPDDVLEGKVWRPAEIIDMIADIDPNLQHDSVLRIGPQPGPGLPPTQMFEIGRQSGLSKDLVRKVYHKLGFYLHARTDRNEHDATHLRKRLLKLMPYLEKFENDTTISAIAERLTFQCQACGRPIAKRTEHITRDPYVRCPNTRCGAMYKHIEGNAHKMLQHNMKCERCGGDNWLDVHRIEQRLERGETVTCRECHAEYELQRYVLFKRKESA